MAKLLEQRRSPTTKQLATISRILDRHRVWAVSAQNVPDQLTLLAEPVTQVVEALQPTRRAQPAKKRVKRKQVRVARAGPLVRMPPRRSWMIRSHGKHGSRRCRP